RLRGRRLRVRTRRTELNGGAESSPSTLLLPAYRAAVKPRVSVWTRAAGSGLIGMYVIVTAGGTPALPVASDIAEQHEQVASGPFRRRLASANSVGIATCDSGARAADRRRDRICAPIFKLL